MGGDQENYLKKTASYGRKFLYHPNFLHTFIFFLKNAGGKIFILGTRSMLIFISSFFFS